MVCSIRQSEARANIRGPGAPVLWPDRALSVMAGTRPAMTIKGRPCSVPRYVSAYADKPGHDDGVTILPCPAHRRRSGDGDVDTGVTTRAGVSSTSRERRADDHRQPIDGSSPDRIRNISRF